MKRIFLVDDHPMMREGICRSLMEHGWDVCGQAESSLRALEEIPVLMPDLAIVDISLPDKNGLELIKDLRSLLPDLKILVFSMHDETLYAERALRAGAKGYVMKGEATAVLLRAIGEVLGGGHYLSGNVSRHLFRSMASGRSRSLFGLDRLTDRELEIFELIGLGKSSSQISSQLHISPKTVDAHRMNMKSKLNIPDAPGLVRAAVLWTEQRRDKGPA